MLLPILVDTQLAKSIPSKEEIGGKAFSLALLAKEGLSIPNTWVVPVSVFNSIEQNYHIDSTMHPKSWFPKELLSSLSVLVQTYSGRWIVRSSAIDEDGVQFSFAGQYESVGSVTTYDEMLSAVHNVWRSYFAAHVDVYRKEERTGMAVIIQQEIEAVFAGVLFTQNPISGKKSELVLESVAGKGEDLVSAQVVPGRSLFLCLSYLRKTGFLRKYGLIHKSSEKEEWLPSMEQQKRICSSGCMLEVRCGYALDLEWVVDVQGRIFFVQMRPITTGNKNKGEVLWTRQFLGERWTIPATELGWNEIDDIMTPLIDYRDTHIRYLGGEKATRLYRYCPYLNATIFRHLLFRLPNAKPTPSFFLEMLPLHEQERWIGSPFVLPDWKVYASIISTTITEERWKRFRWNPFTNYQKWDVFLVRLKAFLQEHTDTLHSLSEAKERLDACRQMASEYLKVHVCSLIYANLWHQWAVWRLRTDGLEQKIPLLIRAHKRTATQRANYALWLLGNGKTTLESVLNEFGMRSENSWALFAPRWKEVPEDVLLLSSWMKGTPNPIAEEEKTVQILEEEHAKLPFALRKKIRIVQQYLYLREEQRFFFEHLLFLWKETWLWIEEYEGFPIRHLEKKEIAQYWEGAFQDAQEIALKRQQSWLQAKETWKEKIDLPQFLLGNTTVVSPQSAAKIHKGIGISSGYVQGKARIMRSLHDAQEVLFGDILIVSTLEPGWTPLLLKAGGVIMELGGMLSHGAVITREYGVPAVAAVEGACSLFHNGEDLAIDGQSGTIWRTSSSDL